MGRKGRRVNLYVDEHRWPLMGGLLRNLSIDGKVDLTDTICWCVESWLESGIRHINMQERLIKLDDIYNFNRRK